jgi:predicted nucleic acid-binding protein
LLVDTSVWIQVFRRDAPLQLEPGVPFDEIVTCLPVIQEVLQGIDEARPFRLAKEAMFALPIVESPLRPAVFEEAADLYRRARRAGQTVRSGVDCLIAACALRHDLTIVHDDRDFTALSRVSTLRVRTLRRPRR